MEIYDTIIIGAGIAGLTSAIYLRRAGKTVLILEAKIHGGQIINTINIENWPGRPGISGADLMKEIYEQATNLGVEIEYEEVTSIKKSGDIFTIETEDDTYQSKTIIFATGTEPRKLSAEQTAEAEGKTISYCATCDGALYKDQPVVVVGSGNTAKHETAYLENIASKVYHIHHNDHIPEDAVAVFVAIGRVPNTKIAEDLVELDSDGYIVAGEDCITSMPGVFVAGDCRTKPLHQLVTAAGDGATASEAAIHYLNR